MKELINFLKSSSFRLTKFRCVFWLMSFCFGNFNPQAPLAEILHSLKRAQRSLREPWVDPRAAYLHRDLSICSSPLAGWTLVLTCRLARRMNASSAAFKIPLYLFFSIGLSIFHSSSLVSHLVQKQVHAAMFFITSFHLGQALTPH